MARSVCMAVACMWASAPAQAAASNVAQLGKLLMKKDPSAMLTQLEEIVRSGETPAYDLVATIKSTILDEIAPALQTTRDTAAQTTTNRLNQAKLCNTQSKTRAEEIEATTQVSVNNARSLHATCRDLQKTMYHHNLTNTDSHCVNLGKFLHAATEKHFPPGSNRDDMVAYVKDASSTNICSNSEVTELADSCTAKEAELTSKHASCSIKQESFEVAFCTWKTQWEVNIETLKTCHSTAMNAYNNHVGETKTLVKKWDVESGALQKVLCYCNVWLSEKDESDTDRSQHNATQFGVCKDQTYVPIQVDYGTPQAEVDLPLDALNISPGTTGFTGQEYSSFTDFVVQVIPCLET